MPRWYRIPLLACFVLLTAALPARAEPFRVDVAGLGTAIGTVPQMLLDGHFGGSLGSSGNASAVSDRGILLAKADCRNPVSCLCTPQIGPAGAQTVLFADDVVISGPAEPAAIDVTMNLILDGSMTVDEIGFWGSRLELSISCASTNRSGVMSINSSGLFSNGVLAGLGPNSGPRAITLPLTIAVNQPFNFLATLVASVGGTSVGNAAHSASSNFFDEGGLHFPTIGPVPTIAGPVHSSGGAAPVFTLPAGYTANSTTLNIVNNTWQGTLPTGTAKTSWGRLKSLYR